MLSQGNRATQCVFAYTQLTLRTSFTFTAWEQMWIWN